MHKHFNYILSAAVLLTAALTVSCSKQETETIVAPSYTMTVHAAKTKALSDDGSAISSTWTKGDAVTVWSNDGSVKYGTLTAKTGGATTSLSGSLDALPRDGETLLLKYLSDSYGTQDGTLTGNDTSIDKVCDYATASVTAKVEGNSVSATAAGFASQSAILKLTVQNASGTDITASITALRVSDGNHVYYVSPSSLGTIYVALPAVGSNQVIGFVATTASGNYRKSVTGKTLAAGSLTPVTVNTLYEGALTGLFTVSSGKKVRFAQGNLQAVFAAAGKSCTWQLAPQQYSYVGNAAANTSINGSGSVSTAGSVDLFGWNGASSGVDNYGINNSENDADYGATTSEDLKTDWGHNSISGGGSAADAWRTPTRVELVSILKNRVAPTVTTVNSVENARYAKATVNDVQGLLLIPDNYVCPSAVTEINNANEATVAYSANTYSGDDWVLLEDAGVVFLPAAGFREGVVVNRGGDYGRYWAKDKRQANSASTVYFTSDTYDTCSKGTDLSRHYGCAVRLVRDAQ